MLDSMLKYDADIIDVAHIPQDHVDRLWNDAAPLLEKAQRRVADKMDLDDVLNDIRGGSLQLWMVVVNGVLMAAMTTRIVSYPKKKNLLINLIGGYEMDRWMPSALDALKEMAKINGLSGIEGYGRKGWEKILKNTSFVPVFTNYEMEI
jgi:hypothetical protein